MDFKNITEEQMQAAKLKFVENNLGVQMNKFATGTDAKWGELTDPELYSLTAIRNKMLETSAKINAICQDPILGDTSIAFVHTNARGKKIKVSFEDIYLFLRAAFVAQKETAEFKTARKKAQDLRNFINKNKTTDERLKESETQLKELNAKFGEELLEDEN